MDQELKYLFDQYNGIVPESAPVRGWEVEIPYSSELCELNHKRHYVLTEEAWFSGNILHPYWILGCGSYPYLNNVLFYFTNENDHMMFKLRWSK